MADLTGTVVIAPIRPTSTEDRYPTHESLYSKGGYRTVQSLAERDAISDERREQGMLVWVNSEKHLFRLTNGTTNSDWENLGNGSSTAYEPVSAFEWTLKVQVNNNDPTDLTVEAKYEPQVIFNSDGDIVMTKVQY